MAALTLTSCRCALPSPCYENNFGPVPPQCTSGVHPSATVLGSGDYRVSPVSFSSKADSRSRVSADDFSDFTPSAASRCSSGAHASVAVLRSVESRDLALSSSVKKACKWSSRSRVPGSSFSDSTPAAASFRGTTSPQNGATCSSSCSAGSRDSSICLGEYPRGSLGNREVLPPSTFSSRRKRGRRHRHGHGYADGQPRDHHRGAIVAQAQEEAAIMNEIADLSESLLSLKGVVTTEYRTIGPEMRGRVERLCERAVVLQQSADRAMSSGSRIPTQLTASLIALQREHGSLENIVRLAMEASPSLANLEAAVAKSSSLSETASNLLLEEAKPKESIFESLVLQSALEPAANGASPPPKYAMSAPASQGSSPLAAFRAEIERRVIEQLSGKKLNKSVTMQIPERSEVSNPSLFSTRSHPSDGSSALTEKETLVETCEAQEQENDQLSGPSAEESAGRVPLLEGKLKQLELELSKSIPLQVFERKVEKINSALCDARNEVQQLNNAVAEKEAVLAALRKEMLAEHNQLTQKVRELTGDLEKMYSVEDMTNAVNFALADLEKELEEEQDRAFLLSVELEKKEKFIGEQEENWKVLKEEMEQKLQKEQDRACSLSLELETKELQMVEQGEVWMVEKRALEADLKSKKETEQLMRKDQNRALSLILELETKEKQTLEREEIWKAERKTLEADITSKEETGKKLRNDHDQALTRILELETKENQMIAQEELWKVEKSALEAELKSKQETEQNLQKEHDRAVCLLLELETKEKQMLEMEKLWKVEKTALQANLKSIQAKLQDIRKKRTKERAQLVEKKKIVKLLEQELKRLKESMEEADRIRVQKKEATYATVRMLITQMVQSSRAMADSEAHAGTLVEDVSKLQEENQTLGHSSKVSEEKAGHTKLEIEGIKASLAKVGTEVANLQGEVPLGERAVALEKFFGIMAQLIKRESENMADLSALDTEFASDNEIVYDEEDHDFEVTAVGSLASKAGARDEDTKDQEELTK